MNILKQTPENAADGCTTWLERPQCNAALDDVADDVRRAAWCWLDACIKRKDAADGGEGNVGAWTLAEQVTARNLAGALQKFYAPSSHGIAAIDNARRAAVNENARAATSAWHAADGGAE